jgi:hypothetical protein
VTDFPGEHPEPPSDLDGRSPLFVKITPGTVFSRIHNRSKGPVIFGRSGGNRFDAPAGSFGVLYVGSDERSAFIETFGQDTGTRPLLRRRKLLNISLGDCFELFSNLTEVAIAFRTRVAEVILESSVIGGPKVPRDSSEAKNNLFTAIELTRACA